MRKYTTAKTIISALFISSGIQCVNSAPLLVNITGNVIASPCNVDTANTNLNVILGDIPATDMASAGVYGGTEQAFTVALKDCPASTTKSLATFSGTPYTGNNMLFANTGTATGLGVKIIPASAAWSDTSVNPGQGTWLQTINATTHTVSYPFKARAFTSTGNVTPGTIISTMQIDFTYQ